MKARILIIDDVATNRLVLKVKLINARYDVMTAENGTQALELAKSEQPHLILMDVQMPQLSGIETCVQLKSMVETKDIPLILISSDTSEQTRLEGLKAGADDFISRPFHDDALMARIRAKLRVLQDTLDLDAQEAQCALLGLTGATSGAAQTIGLISAKPQTAQSWKQALSKLLPHRLKPLTPDAVLSGSNQAQADLYVIEIDLQHKEEGLRLMADLKSRRFSRNAAFVIALKSEESERAALALDLGANDICALPLTPNELALRINAQLARISRTERLRLMMDDGVRLALTDPLTGLHNRRYGMSRLAELVQRSKTNTKALSLAMVDLDLFKDVNDQYGHSVGDMVLREVARLLEEKLRPGDVLCRIGGEEFLLMMPNLTALKAAKICETLRKTLSQSIIHVGLTKGISLTASIGLSEVAPSEETGSVAMIRADQALYAAKAKGRNRIEIASLPRVQRGPEARRSA